MTQGAHESNGRFRRVNMIMTSLAGLGAIGLFLFQARVVPKVQHICDCIEGSRAWATTLVLELWFATVLGLVTLALAGSYIIRVVTKHKTAKIFGASILIFTAAGIGFCTFAGVYLPCICLRTMSQYFQYMHR